MAACTLADRIERVGGQSDRGEDPVHRRVQIRRFVDRRGVRGTGLSATVHPHRSEAEPGRRHDVVEEALRDVQDFLFGLSQPIEGKFKVLMRRFV